MKEFFDLTGTVRKMAGYIAFSGHPHDDVCFYDLPYANDREYIAKLREYYAKLVIRFSFMNHLGMKSNCSSLAEYLRSGALIDITEMEKLLSYRGEMFPYRGQHISFGDVVALYYLREKEFHDGFSIRDVMSNAVQDFAEERRGDACQKNFLEAYTVSHQDSSVRDRYSREDVLELMDTNIFLCDYHFAVCIAYATNPQTGNLEPVFIEQNGRNIRTEDFLDGMILLPPFGELRLSFMSAYVEAGRWTPALALCSKPF